MSKTFKLITYHGSIEGSIDISDWQDAMMWLQRTIKRCPKARIMRIDRPMTGIAIFTGHANKRQVEDAVLKDLGIEEETL